MKKTLTGLIPTIMSLILLLSSSTIVYAENNNTLNISFMYEKTPISGAEFSIYQIGILNEKKTAYSIKSPFVWSGNFGDLDTAEKHEEAVKNFESQTKNIKPIAKRVTDENGNVSFTGLNDGIYLVVQSGSTGSSLNYTKGQSFLVNDPMYINGKWQNVVNAIPKTSVNNKEVQIPNKPSNPPEKTKGNLPKTGDINDPFLWGSLVLIGGIIILLLGIYKRNKQINGINKDIGKVRKR
ncbi:TPA: hypothetical protein I9097_001274 [Clostridium perfringens]|nr:hypothetical protein [Clostridium perfringens]